MVFLSIFKPVALEIKKHGVSDESPVWSVRASTFYKFPLHTKYVVHTGLKELIQSPEQSVS